MARISGVDLPKDKRVEVALTYIYGIGITSSKRILAAANVSSDIRVKNLTEDEVHRLQTVINDEFKVEGDLRREISQDIKRLIDIGLLPGHAAPPRAADARPADPDQRPDTERPAQDRGQRTSRVG